MWAVRADRAASSQTRATSVRPEHGCTQYRVQDLDRRQQTRDRLEAGMMNTLPNAPLSVGTPKTWHCTQMSTGISWEQPTARVLSAGIRIEHVHRQELRNRSLTGSRFLWCRQNRVRDTVTSVSAALAAT